ncbi:hypothetical protein AB4Z22_04030 [Paenibacillus sp. TAF58]
MLAIQLNPQLHHTVHKLKTVYLRKDANALFNQSLSHEESSAIIGTFSRTSNKEPKEPNYSWWD